MKTFDREWSTGSRVAAGRLAVALAPWLVASACHRAPPPPSAPPPRAAPLDAGAPADAPVDRPPAPRPLRFERTVRVAPSDAGAAATRVLLVRPPGADELRSGRAYVPMLCFDAAARRVIANPACAARLRAGTVVPFPDGSSARVMRAAPVSCEYENEPRPGGRRQPGVALDGASGEPGDFAVWPSGVVWTVAHAGADDGADAPSFASVPAPERAALAAAAGDPVDDAIHQAIGADVDGDGLDEHLYVLSTRAPAASEDLAQPPSQVVCVVSGADRARASCFTIGPLRDPKVVAAVDFDGDATLELLLDVPGNDFMSYALWRREGEAWVSIGTSNCR